MPKNIILVMTDQQRYDHAGFMGSSKVDTPNMDRLAGSVAFTNAYTVNPICTPARCALITGKYSHQIGMLQMSGDLDFQYPTFMKSLQGAGYHTMGIGKFHFLQTWNWSTKARQGLNLVALNETFKTGLGFDHIWQTAGKQQTRRNYCHYAQHLDQKGVLQKYDEFVASVGPNHNVADAPHDDHRDGQAWPFNEEDHVDIVTCDKALEAMENRPKGKPFYLFLSFCSPHRPFEPPQRYLDRVPYEEVEDFIPGRRTLSIQDKKRLWRNRRAYRALVKLVDDQIGRLLAHLEREDLLKDTVILFTSDHGEMMGDHGCLQKNLYFKESALVPTAIRHPDFLHGQTNTSPVEITDLAATILDIAGLDAQKELSRPWPAFNDIVPSRSLMPVVRQEKEAVRKFAFAECPYYTPDGNDSIWTMTATREFKYVKHSRPRLEDSSEEFYDLANDPQEATNQIGNPAFAEQIAWHRQQRDHLMSTTPHAQTRWAPLPGTFRKGLALLLATLVAGLGATAGWSSAAEPGAPAPVAAGWPTGMLDWPALNTQALEEATQPVRPGVPGQRPFWNGRASFFIYAPAFEFAEVAGASRYRFTVSSKDNQSFTFDADKPWAALTPVWKDLPVGPLSLVVEGLEATGGKPVGQAGTRSFNRKVPFRGLTPEPALDYDQAVREACQWMFNSAYFAQFRQKKDQYDLGRYPSKYASTGVILGMTCYARLQPRPAEADQAIEMARNAARALIAASFREDAALPYFPPTYDKSEKIMMNYPAHAGWCYLELFELTQEQEFLQAAIRIGETYRKCQLPSGTWPLTMQARDGKGATAVELVPTDMPEISVIGFIERLVTRHGQKQLQATLDSCAKYLCEGPIKTFYAMGMFEDVRPTTGNLSGNTAAAMAVYLFTHVKDDRDIQVAEDFVRMEEDVFIFWEKASRGSSPAGYEQYACYKPVSCSASFYMDSCLAAYRATGKKLYLAKAIKMANAHVDMIRRSKGCLPTWWRPGEGDAGWPNCPALSTVSLARFAAEAGKILHSGASIERGRGRIGL